MVFIFLWFIGFLPLIFSLDITKKSEIASAIKCPCDVTEGSCDYHCCCDDDCDSTLINRWKDKFDSNDDKRNNVCIDEQSSFNKIEYSCVDNNLILKYNEKRGMTNHKEKKNLCVMMDNDNYDNAYYKTLPVDKVENIFKGYVEETIIASQIPTSSIDKVNMSNYAFFQGKKNNLFIDQEVLFIPSPDPYGFCSSKKKLLKYQSISTECYNEYTFKDVRDSLKEIWGDSIVIPTCGDEDKVVEIEINIIELSTGENQQKFNIFCEDKQNKLPTKFSIIFVNKQDDNIKYDSIHRSGNNGYLVGYPLKFKHCINSICWTFRNGINFICREKNYTILYGFDFEIQCDEDSLLRNFEKMVEIGPFGSSDVDTSDWFGFGFGLPVPKVLNFLFFIGEGGFETNPQEYISRTSYLGSDRNSNNILFRIKFIRMKKSLFSEEVSMPTILPRIPEDLVEPFLRPEI